MALDQDIGLLSRVPLFASFHRDALRLLASSAQPLHLSGGDVLFEAGDPADGGYVVAKGGIALVDKEGRTFGDILLPERLIGELALLTPTFRPVSAVAKIPTALLYLPRATFRKILEEYPAIAKILALHLRNRITGLSNELSQVRGTFFK